MSKSYSKEVLEYLAKGNAYVILETTYHDEVLVGYFFKHIDGCYGVKGLDHTKSLVFKKSCIKRIIYANTGYTLPKTFDYKRMGKTLNLFELNELVNKAGYQFI